MGKKKNNRRSFLKTITLGSLATAAAPTPLLQAQPPSNTPKPQSASPTESNRPYNTPYTGEYLNRVAFPIGGIGAGMFCLEGTGALSHMSIRHRPEIYNEPPLFAAISVKDIPDGAKVLEGPVPTWKYFGPRGTGNGKAGATYGLPRFRHASFEARFPFASLQLQDDDLPITITLTGWSPFIPTDEDNSSLPVGALEYNFVNTGAKPLEAVFSFNTKNFLHGGNDGNGGDNADTPNSIAPTPGGFILKSENDSFAVYTDEPAAIVDHCWFRGGWWDPLTMAWNTVKEGKTRNTAPVEKDAPGASLFVPLKLVPNVPKTITLRLAWYVPNSSLHIGDSLPASKTYQPWYSGRFTGIGDVIDYWNQHYTDLRKKTTLFHDAFHASTLPPEVMEAVAANLTILKSPTVLRQRDGRLWSWEGCGDDSGCCHGSCTHVWNYAQAIPHLFPNLERSLRHTEFNEDQDEAGHQTFRANLPISPAKHDFYAAADGQLGGIMKVYRDWRISGDDAWLANLYPKVKASMDYCIKTWDPRAKGVVEQPHHNTYDIEFWGADGMCTSFYLGALKALTEMGSHLGQDTASYRHLYEKGRQYMETRLFNGEYFIQEIEYKELDAPDPAKAQSYGGDYSPEALDLLKKEGPKYQYGAGCLSDGVLGAWIGKVCGLDDFLDAQKIQSHLLSVHRYNLSKDLSEHANPQRPAYALGHEGGLLLCTWPKGGRLSLPFVYSDEVWTGIEYQVAAHLMLTGNVAQGLGIVRLCRDRYDGRIRNPFNEYECGHWYARAMSSYGLLQGLTGLRYDAVEKTLYVHSQIGDFTCFLSTATGFGTVSYKNGKTTLQVVYGSIPVQKIIANTGATNFTSALAPAAVLAAPRTAPRPTKVHLLGGFLGSGKTTAIEQACKLLKDTPVAVITNDQGASLVDGHRFRHLGIPSAEVAGGCFCCNYNHLDAHLRSLVTTHQPAILFAESVGSCTDLVATVLKPLLDQHPDWQPTVSVFADAHYLDNPAFDPGVRYIYEKQLEEAQVIVITRSEAFPPQWKQQVHARFAGKIVLFHNSYNESDIRRWLDTLNSLPPRPLLPSLDIDYDIYAGGEASLAWLDQELAVPGQQAAHDLMNAIHDKLKKENYPVRRLKFWQTPATLLINARVQTDPETLSQLVAGAIAETPGVQTLSRKVFQPGYPKPQYRLV